MSFTSLNVTSPVAQSAAGTASRPASQPVAQSAAQPAAITRRTAVSVLAAGVAGAALCAPSAHAPSLAHADEAAPAFPAATGFALPAGLELAEDGTLGDVLVVVDMQNAYLEDQCWACIRTSVCADNIIKIIESGLVDNVVFTQYLAPENPVGTWVTYNEVNAEVNADEWLNAYIDALLPYTERYPMYSKSTYSSFGNPDFKALMARAGRIVMAGVMSECCVLATAVDAIDTGTPLVYLSDACSGSSQEFEDMVVSLMEFASPTHTTVMTTDEYLTAKGA